MVVNHFSESVWQADIVTNDTIYGKVHNAKVSFIAYPFFLPQQPYHTIKHVHMLDAKDIAVMKIVAISQRGRKRDFLDLYWYVRQQEPLSDILLRLPKQYPTVAHDYNHILKSLMYFVDAEHDPMPRTFFAVSWMEIKQYFKKEIPRILEWFVF